MKGASYGNAVVFGVSPKIEIIGGLRVVRLP